MNLFTISTAELVALNAIAVQYIRQTDPSCSSDCRTAFNHFWFFAELTVVVYVRVYESETRAGAASVAWVMCALPPAVDGFQYSFVYHLN